MNARTAFLLAMSTAGLIIFAIGCGSSDSSGNADSGESLSKTEFVKQANAACQSEREKVLTRIGAFSEELKGEKKLSQSERSEKALEMALFATVQAEIDAVEKLAPPPDQQEQVEAMLAGQEALLEKAKGKAEQLDPTELEELMGTDDGPARALGLTACTKGGG